MDLVAGLRKRTGPGRRMLLSQELPLRRRPSRAKSRSVVTIVTNCTSTAGWSDREKTGKCLMSTTSPPTWLPGTNIIAIKAINDEQGSAGLAARVVVKQEGGTAVTHSTDASWKTSLREFVGWQKARVQRLAMAGRPRIRPRRRHAPLGQRSHGRPAQERFKVLPKFQRRVGHRSQGDRLAGVHDVRRIRPDHRRPRKRAADRGPRLRIATARWTRSARFPKRSKAQGLALGQRKDFCRRRRARRNGPLSPGRRRPRRPGRSDRIAAQVQRRDGRAWAPRAGARSRRIALHGRRQFLQGGRQRRKLEPLSSLLRRRSAPAAL